MSILGYGWTHWHIGTAIVVVFVLVLAIAVALSVYWSRSRGKRPPTPRLILRGDENKDIERQLLEPAQPLAPLELQTLDAENVDPDLSAYLGEHWLDHAKIGIGLVGRCSLGGSRQLRAKLAGEALRSATRMTVLTDAQLIPAIAKDISAASVLHALACHNLKAWVSHSASDDAKAAFESSLEHCRSVPSTAADMLAQIHCTEPLAALIRHAIWLGEVIQSDRDLAVEARGAASRALGNVTRRAFLVLHLFQREWGLDNVWAHILKAEDRRAVAGLWNKHAILKVTRRRVRGIAPRKDYRWYMLADGEDEGILLLEELVTKLCPQREIAGGHKPGKDPRVETQVAGLICSNPFDLIGRLSTFPWDSCGMTAASLPGQRAPDWQWLAPLLRKPYWSLHDKVADRLIRSLCRVANGKSNALERRLMGALFSPASPIPFAGSDSESSSANVADSELYFGAQHLAICCCEQLIQRNRAGIGLDTETAAEGKSPISGLLLAFHQTRVEHHRRVAENAVDTSQDLLRERYAEFVNSGSEAEMIQLCVTRAGAFYPGRPQPVTTWPPSQNAALRAEGLQRPRTKAVQPVILESYGWGDTFEFFGSLLATRDRWQQVKKDREVYVLKLNGQALATMDLAALTMTVPDRVWSQEASRKLLEDELWELAFRTYAVCIEGSFAIGLSEQSALARLAGEGSVDGRVLHVELDWHDRMWRCDRWLIAEAQNNGIDKKEGTQPCLKRYRTKSRKVPNVSAI